MEVKAKPEMSAFFLGYRSQGIVHHGSLELRSKGIVVVVVVVFSSSFFVG